VTGSVNMLVHPVVSLGQSEICTQYVPATATCWAVIGWLSGAAFWLSASTQVVPEIFPNPTPIVMPVTAVELATVTRLVTVTDRSDAP
jgi:hypothetical protein